MVVFTQRLETSKALAPSTPGPTVVQETARVGEQHADRLRRHVEKVAKWLRLDRKYAAGVVKVMAHSADRPQVELTSVRKWWGSP